MCLNQASELKVAEADIPCFKVLAEVYDAATEANCRMAPYRYIIYPSIGGQIESDLEAPNGDTYSREIYRGLHSFATWEDADAERDWHGRNSVYEDSCYKVYHAVIPKGASYYEGVFDFARSYASDKLIVNGEVV